MRNLILLAAAAAVLPTLALADPAPTKAPTPPPQPASPQPNFPVQTTDSANREGVRGAVTSPLRDLNAIRTQIPMVLRIAAQDPYARPAPNTCAALGRAVADLNEALGADLDEPPSPDERDLTERGQELAIDALGSAARGVIPLRGWVRRLSGADQHDREVAAAITAGQVRRGYLKGLGEARGCRPPATPRHLANPPPPPEPPRRGPRYPTRR